MGKNGEFWNEDLWKWLYILPESGQKSLGQSFLKDCRFQKDRVLCLHPKPTRNLFHDFQSLSISVVPRSGTQNIVQKEKVAVSGVL